MSSQCSCCDSTMIPPPFPLTPGIPSLSSPNGYIDLTHFPKIDRREFDALSKICQICRECLAESCQENPDRPIDVMKFCQNSNLNAMNRKRSAFQAALAPDPREMPLDKNPSKKHVFTPNVFKALAHPACEDVRFEEKIRQLIDMRRGLASLRMKAQEYGEKKNIYNIDKSYIQDALILTVCTRNHWRWRSDDEANYLLAIQDLGIQLPDPSQYKTNAEKNELLEYVFFLRSSLVRMSNKNKKIIKDDDADEILTVEQKKLQTVSDRLKKIEQEVQEKIEYVTTHSRRAQIFGRVLMYLKEVFGKTALPKSRTRPPQLLSILWFLTAPFNTSVYPSEQIKILWDRRILPFRSDDAAQDEDLRKRFFEALLQKEQDLRIASQISQGLEAVLSIEDEAAIEELRDMLQ